MQIDRNKMKKLQEQQQKQELYKTHFGPEETAELNLIMKKNKKDREEHNRNQLLN